MQRNSAPSFCVPNGTTYHYFEKFQKFDQFTFLSKWFKEPLYNMLPIAMEEARLCKLKRLFYLK